MLLWVYTGLKVHGPLTITLYTHMNTYGRIRISKTVCYSSVIHKPVNNHIQLWWLMGRLYKYRVCNYADNRSQIANELWVRCHGQLVDGPPGLHNITQVQLGMQKPTMSVHKNCHISSSLCWHNLHFMKLLYMCGNSWRVYNKNNILT